MWSVLYRNEKKLLKSLATLRPVAQVAFHQAIEDLRREGPVPAGWNVKRMQGSAWENCYRLRLDYRHRLIYEACGDALRIVILQVGTRRDIYR